MNQILALNNPLKDFYVIKQINQTKHLPFFFKWLS